MASWSCSTAACCSRSLDPACCPGSSSSSVNSAIPGSSPCYPGLASMHPVARHPVRKALAGRGCRTAAIPAAAGSCAMRFPWSVQAGRRSFRRRSPFASAPAAPNARASDCFARTTCSPSTASFAAGSTSWPDRPTGTRSRSRTGCRLRSRRPLSKVPLLQLQCVVSFERPFHLNGGSDSRRFRVLWQHALLRLQGIPSASGVPRHVGTKRSETHVRRAFAAMPLAMPRAALK
jgi:hypothetical protein